MHGDDPHVICLCSDGLVEPKERVKKCKWVEASRAAKKMEEPQGVATEGIEVVENVWHVSDGLNRYLHSFDAAVEAVVTK